MLLVSLADNLVSWPGHGTPTVPLPLDTVGEHEDKAGGWRDCSLMRRGLSMAPQHIHTYCVMCVSRCGVVVKVEDGLFQKVTADPVHPNGCICVQGTAAPEMSTRLIVCTTP